MRQTNLSQNSYIALVVIAIIGFVTVASVLNGGTGIDLLTSDTDTGTTSTPSGMELVTVSGDEELSLLRGCVADEILKLQNSGSWACAEDSTTSITGAGAVAFDAGDDDSNESSGINEIATVGDTNSIFTESTDKVTIAVTANWPTADAAVASTTDPDDCSANQFATGINTTWDLTCAQPAFSDISGAATDAQIPNDITIDNAATADALTANGGNCSAGQAAGGVDASGAAESCVNVYSTIQGDGSSLTQRATLNLTGSGVTCSDTGAITQCDFAAAAGDGTGYDTIQDEGSGVTQRSTVNFAGNGVSCADNAGSSRTDCTITDTDTSANTECAGSNTYLDGEGNCDTLDGLEDFETATDDGVAVGNGTTFDTKVIGDCDDTGGNHLNYDTTANAFSCGTSGDGTGYDTIQDDGTPLTQRATLNMTGSAVTCADTGSITECTITSGGGSSNAFGTWDLPDGDDIVADSSTDTATITAGDGLDITGTSGTDTVLFEFNAGELGTLTWGANSGFTWTFDAGGATDVSFTFGDGLLTFAGNWLMANQGELRFGELTVNGSNYIAVEAPAAVTSNQTCTLEDDATPFDSCVTANPADQNLFETISTTSGTSPVADSTTDTLTLTAGTGITVTGDSSTDTVTIASTVTDTNANTICTGTDNYLDGEGNCDVLNTESTTGGRSTTLNGSAIDADAELYTVKKSINITSPTTASHTNLAQFEYATAATITEVSCSTDTGTITIQFDERARATPNTAGTDVMTSALVCDSDTETTTSFTNAGIAAGVPVNLQLTAQSGTPGVVRIHVKATKDD